VCAGRHMGRRAQSFDVAQRRYPLPERGHVACARKRRSRARPIMSAPSGEIGSGGRVNHAWMRDCVRVSV
jgi:hypothetical protein